MSERMTDERLKQLSDWAEIMPRDNPARPVFMELLQALKAERAVLEAVRGLPNELRDELSHYPEYSVWAKALECCADKIDAALKQ